MSINSVIVLFLKMGKNKHLEIRNKKSYKVNKEKDNNYKKISHSSNKKSNNSPTRNKSNSSSQNTIKPLVLHIPTTFPAFNYEKHFWTGVEGESAPSDSLKECRKAYGINVKGNSLHLSPPPLDEFSCAGLTPEIYQLLSHYAITTPSSIQRQAIPTIMSGCDVLG